MALCCQRQKKGSPSARYLDLYTCGNLCLSSVLAKERMRGERMQWMASLVLALGYLGRRAVFALPHEVVALPGTTDTLSLRLFVAKSEVTLYLVLIRACT